uniref:Uncharacterized protein n=1 Tax=Meloidogyne incognita TaxID=6306 RepID=A0A914NH93_MELIC
MCNNIDWIKGYSFLIEFFIFWRIITFMATNHHMFTPTKMLLNKLFLSPTRQSLNYFNF